MREGWKKMEKARRLKSIGCLDFVVLMKDTMSCERDLRDGDVSPAVLDHFEPWIEETDALLGGGRRSPSTGSLMNIGSPNDPPFALSCCWGLSAEKAN